MKKVMKDIFQKLFSEYIIHTRNLKQALNQGLVFRNVHRVITFNKNAWLKPYIDMNTDLRRKAINDFEKDFCKLMNNAILKKLGKMLGNIEILNLSQQKKEETIWCRNQVILQQSSSQKIY